MKIFLLICIAAYLYGGLKFMKEEIFNETRK